MAAPEGQAFFVASLMRDLVAVSSKLPRPGETLTGSKFFMGFGGKGANQCVMAARLGATTVIVGKVGDDDNGRAYKEELERQGVDTKYLRVEPQMSTGVASILVESTTGENLIVIVPGANDRLGVEDVRQTAEDIRRSKVVVGVLEVGEEAVLAGFTVAREAGVVTVLNAAPAKKDVMQELLSNTDILCVNETEAEGMTGVKDLDTAAKELQRKGCRNIIITLGAAGALVLEKGGVPVRVCGARLEGCVVDTTGAGDAFVGSLAYFISSHPTMGLQEKVKRSCSLASLTVLKAGTQSSYPYRAQVEHLLTE